MVRKRASAGRVEGSRPGRSVDLERYRSIVSDWPRFVEAAARPEPTVFRVCARSISEEDVLDRLRAQGFTFHALEGLDSFYQVEQGPRPVSLTLEHWAGLIYVQQASTGVAAPALDAAPGERVLDLCAAPGGKTTHIADLMEDRGCLVACEISESRIRGLLGNVYRLGHTNVLAVAGDGRDLPEGPVFDRVLVDAPCTGEGTLRRRGGRVPRRSASFEGYVTRAQRGLLEKAVRLTRPGGTILYVTCTFDPAENEAVVSDILASSPVELEPLALEVAHAPGLTSFEGVRFDPRLEGAARIYPHHFDSGGLFLAKLRRVERGADQLRVGEPAEAAEVRSGGGALGGNAGGRGDAPRERRPAEDGWTPIGPRFPDEPLDADAARGLIEAGLAEVAARYGVPESRLAEWGWTVRGGRVWMHTAGEWPLDTWKPNGWRPVSLGVRAIEFDTRGRARPTNDFLRCLGTDVRAGAADLDRGELTRLLGGAAVAAPAELPRGPVALRHQGEVVGRGAMTVDGLKSEIPKARAADLARVLEG